jgi:hypothetical protein
MGTGIDMASVYAAKYRKNPDILRAAVMGQSPDKGLDSYTALNALKLVNEADLTAMSGQAQQPTSAPSFVAQALTPPPMMQGLGAMVPGAMGGQGMPPQGMPQQRPPMPQPVMQAASGGLAGMPTADEDYANGGIVAFAGPTKANNNSLVRDDNAAIQNVYDAVANDQRVAAYGSEKEPGWGGGAGEDGENEEDAFLSLLDRMESGGSPAGLAASNKLMTGVARRIASRDLRDLDPEDAKKLYATEYEKITKAAGPSPYAAMRSDLTKQGEERASNLNLAQGEALLEAASAVLEGNNAMRGLAKGGAKFAQSYGAAQKADKAARRSAAELEFHINDAERKERMGNSRAATAAVESARKERRDMNKAELDRDIALGRLSTEMGKVNKPLRGAGAGGEKPLKMNEQYYADAINFLKQTEKPKEGETPAQYNARIRFQAGTIAMKQAKTSDIGDVKASVAREGQLLQEDINVQKAMKSFLNNPKFLAADAAGEGDTAFAAELERQRALFPKGRVNPPAVNPLGAPASSSTGGGQRDYSNLWNQTPK